MISDVLDWLSCPHCATALIADADADADADSRSRLLCEEGHAFDIARPGYVSLLGGAGSTGTADTAAMVADRAAFLAAGHYAGIADLVAELAAEADRAVADAVAEAVAEGAAEGAAEAGPTAVEHAAKADRSPAKTAPVKEAQVSDEQPQVSDEQNGACILDLGAGTGYYLARVLDAVDRPGIALDISKHAARHAAKAHPRIGAVVADAWGGLPVRGRAAAVVLNVFAPRNAHEMRRVLHPGGRAVVVVPEPGHLRELIEEYGLLAVDERKSERLREQFAGRFQVESEHPYRRTLDLSAEEVSQVIGMGPNAWHAGAGAGRVRSGGAVSLAVRAYVLSPR